MTQNRPCAVIKPAAGIQPCLPAGIVQKVHDLLCQRRCTGVQAGPLLAQGEHCDLRLRRARLGGELTAFEVLWKMYYTRFLGLKPGAGPMPDAHGAVMPPIYLSSTYAFETVGKQRTFDYGRSGNPTRFALEACLAELEGGIRGFAFGTGMAATATLIQLFNAGDHFLVHDDLYGGTYRLMASVLSTKGVDVEFINMRDLDKLRAAIRPNTRGIWTETPTNPLMNLLDLAAIAEIASANAGIWKKMLATLATSSRIMPGMAARIAPVTAARRR